MPKTAKRTYLDHYGDFLVAMKPGTMCKLKKITMDDGTDIVFGQKKGCVDLLHAAVNKIRFANKMFDRTKVVVNQKDQTIDLVKVK